MPYLSTISPGAMGVYLGLFILGLGIERIPQVREARKRDKEAKLQEELASLCEPKAGAGSGIALTGERMARARRFEQTAAARCLEWAPHFVLFASLLGCSFVEKKARLMWPLPLLISVGLLVVAWLIARKIRHRMMRRVLAEPEAPEQETGDR